MRPIPELDIDLELDLGGVFDVEGSDIPRYYADLKEATTDEIEELVMALRSVAHPLFWLDLGLTDILFLDEPAPVIISSKSNYASDPIASKEELIDSLDYQFRAEIDRSHIVDDFFKNDFPEHAEHNQIVKSFAEKWLSYVSEVFGLLHGDLTNDVFISQAADILSPYFAKNVKELRNNYLKTGNPSSEAELVRALGLASFVESPVEGGDEFEGCTPLPIIQDIWEHNHSLLMTKLEGIAERFDLKRM